MMFPARAQAGYEAVRLTAAQPWQRWEFRITGGPAVSNPFDPDLIRVDGSFVSSAGQASSVPAFWYQGYQRRLSGGSDALSAQGAAEWRLVEIVNLGADWFYLDWGRLEHVLPAVYTNGWEPPCEPIGLGGPREALVYVVAPGTAFPRSATNAALPLQQGQTIMRASRVSRGCSLAWQVTAAW